MNHKNAMPANSNRFKASKTASLLRPSVSQSPASSGSLGKARPTSTNATVSSTEKTIPATAAARGVLIDCLVTDMAFVMGDR